MSDADAGLSGAGGGRGRGRSAAALAVSAAIAAGLLAPALDAAATERARLVSAVPAAQSRVPALPESDALRQKRERGYLTRDAAALAAAKGTSSAATGDQRPGGPLASSIGQSWQGVNDLGVTPPDSTGAIGPTRYVELINRAVGIYDRTGSALDTGTLTELTGITASHADPQIIWDPDTARFYYVVFNVSTNNLSYGWSKTSSPSTDTAADWCKWDMNFGYGTDLPDYPKLGSSDDFLLVGVNAFASAGGYLGSDILWIGKPPAGTACPAPTGGGVVNVQSADGSQAYTPVPAVQTDTGGTGYVISVTDLLTDTRLTRFQVTRNGDGSANIQTTGTTVTVPSYSAPANAPQPGTAKTLDTLDNRLTQAVSGRDPSRGLTSGAGALWTQHTVASSGGRSEVRWYEIDPAAATVAQSGTVSDASLFAFNGAIAPDRRVSGSSTAFGSAMALVFNTSSSAAFTAIQAVTKTAFDPQSAFMLVKQSPGINVDFSCTGGDNDCRWGDYAGASSDPASSISNAYGQVWFSNQWNVASSTESDADWRTWNGSIQLDRSYGFLRVTSSPALPTQILVDGQIMDSWGLTWVKVPTGSHTVSFSDVEGYTTPADQVVNVTEGATTTVEGTFVQRGLLRVTTTPAIPGNGGTISVAGVARNDFGVWTWLPVGMYQVCFGAVVDWLPPACLDAALTAGNQTTVGGTYTSSSGAAGESGKGLLRVMTSPAVPSQIVVNTVPRDNWGLEWLKLGPGFFTVAFTDVEGYTTPADAVVAVNSGATTTHTGTFVQRGLLRVLTSPAVAGTVYVDGIPRNDWGVWTWFPTGAHTVCFDGAAGYTPPACQNVVLTAGAQTTVTGTYTLNT